ncbi:hypothetical protein GO730_05620 [Spirosoma sp. HMF3257]|uniref:Uncharacterized protein n=1 Tax=Spirosoma telluris TaxID=2183553 RepID=A0A327NJ53_9BACT|nr:hypothetical protein [Spirosoma telluris]RAI73954.1 hypothetical protein HMF3257_05580 [Spirosoma telluris]
MNQQEFERITAAARKLGLYGVRTELVADQMFVTFPDGIVMSYQMTKLLEIVKGYAMSIQPKGAALFCTVW